VTVATVTFLLGFFGAADAQDFFGVFGSADRPRSVAMRLSHSSVDASGERDSCVYSELLHISQNSGYYDEPRLVWTIRTTTH
jgi:hypothetical protein